MLKNNIIEKQEICKLIPHDGLMCLLDKVIEWDEKRIVCCSETHQSADNPLRNDQGLPVTALIEYGAQAMAIHGGLLANKYHQVIHESYLASLRNVSIDEAGDVSSIKTMLYIEAIQHMSSQGNMIYTFSIKANQRKLVSGRATVIAVINN